MDNTTHYKLKKPAATDFYNIQDHNDNMDIVDAELKKLNDGKAPSGHGLGGIPDPNAKTTFRSVMKKGCGFYQVNDAEDNPVGRNGWMSMLQFPRIATANSETGVQLVAADDEANPQMWIRAMQMGTVGKWYEIIHTGNLPNYANTRIQSNSYVGTGVGGESVPNRLTFEFVPKLVIVSAPANEGGKIIAINGQSSVELVDCGAANVDTSNIANIYLTWSGKTVSWYVTYGSNNEKRSTYQLNRSGVTYHWVAFG